MKRQKCPPTMIPKFFQFDIVLQYNFSTVMFRYAFILSIFVCATLSAAGQSGRTKGYSESVSRYDVAEPKGNDENPDKGDTEDTIVRIETDLVTIPVRVTTKKGRPVPDLKKSEFRIYENGDEQEIAYFAQEDAPFTVALMLDMSYSSVFKLAEIQAAAMAFVDQLRKDDRVIIISFDKKVRVLCEATDNRKALRYAIEGAKITSGTSVYDAFSTVINERFRRISGRKAIVLLSDGVDTTSAHSTIKSVLRDVDETDALIYPIQYQTYDDVQKNRRKDAEIRYDDNDRPYVVDSPQVKGEREKDYAEAADFLKEVATRTGGRLERVKSTTNLTGAFARIADELRKTYSLGYYPTSERKPGTKYYIRVRVYRPDLNIRARDTYLTSKKRQ